MPSNETPAFDVLSASGRELYLRALHEPDGWQESLVRLRDDIVRALQKPGTPEMGRADLARARVEGAREALTKCVAEFRNQGMAGAARVVENLRDREYPAPKPAECRLSDGRVVEWNEWETPQPHRTLDIVTNKGRAGCESRRCFKSLEDMRALPLPYADWQLIDKAFAATRTEGTDGR